MLKLTKFPSIILHVIGKFKVRLTHLKRQNSRKSHMTTFRDNKTLYGIFQYDLTTTNPPKKLKFSSSQHMHTVSSYT